tara:strand:- start:20 stop:391 length:372 start_codon:yes stop_codon:yes gene_type:complete
MMRLVTLLALMFLAWIIFFGATFTDQESEPKYYHGSIEPILPMTFAHIDHQSVNCLDCHHNFIDDTGDEACMTCHVTNPDVWPLFESQFHELCRGCHIDLAIKHKDSGPLRRCMLCHVEDQLP